MPLFRKKFMPKKAQSRKSGTSLNSEVEASKLVQENGTVNLKLGDQELIFTSGIWRPASNEPQKTYRPSKAQQQLLKCLERSKILKLKMEILINMLAEQKAENLLQQQEIERLRKNQE